jgi:hypothetical protein
MRTAILTGVMLAAMTAGASASPAIQFRPVVDCAANPGAPHLDIYAPQAHCLAPAVITEADFKRLERLRLGGGTFLRGLLTPEAQLRYFAFTQQHRFRPMALLVDDRPTRVWIVGGPVQDNWLRITGGYLSDREAEQVADRYYAEGGRH